LAAATRRPRIELVTPEELRAVIEHAARRTDEAARGCERLLERVRRDRLRCAECFAAWSDDPEARFRGYLTDDEPPDVVLFCPECAETEFG
jgi:Zn finger protein HypA/HybF involved in hydrogenase expression